MLKKKIVIDSILNIIASALPIVVLQLIILPLIAAELGEFEYGTVLTLISLATLFSIPFGNVINNVRLLLDKKYKDDNLEGDFNVILLASIFINIIIMLCGLIYYKSINSGLDTFLFFLYATLSLLREYLIVTFRLVLNYKGIFINNIILGIGYLLGFLLFKLFGYWQLIYIAGAILSLIYIIRNSNIHKEKIKTTVYFGSTFYKSAILFISTLMKSMPNYADKLVLYPLIGASAVSVYYSATLLGKLIFMVITPVSGVMLSYLSKIDSISTKKFLKSLFYVSIFGAFSYIIVIFISAPLLNLLYPKWAEASMELVWITSATAIVGAISSVINPVILRFKNINWQLVINLLNLIVYVIAVYSLNSILGLKGFSLGMLIASLINLIITIAIFLFGKN